jgi:hypothetical protein
MAVAVKKPFMHGHMGKERGQNASPLSENLRLREFLQIFKGFLYFIIRQNIIFEFAG